MTKISLGTHPYMLGFDQLERLLERTAKAGNEGYPPFDIEQTSQNAFRITLALAGFTRDDLSVTVENGQLTISGRQMDDNDARVFLHRGIAAREFKRTFALAEGVEVSAAKMQNGLLHVDLTRAEPEAHIQEIEIAQT